jgi:hypothetical protein
MVPQPLIVRSLIGFGSLAQSITMFPENLRNRVGGVTVAVWSTSAAPSSIKDDAGNSYTLVTSATFFSNNTTSLWYLPLVYGCPQKLTVTFAVAQSHSVAAIFWDQPLTVVSSGTEASNTGTPTVGPLAVKAGEEVLFGLTQHSNLTAGFTPTGCVVFTQVTSQGAVYGYPPTRKVIWAVNPSTGGTSSVAMFKAAPLLTNPYAFDRIMKFPGITPPPDVSVTLSDTLTWTVTAFAAVEVEDFWSDTLTWSDLHEVAAVDAFLDDTLTWTDSHNATEVDEVPLTDTLTWTGTFSGLPEISVLAVDLVVWADEFQFDRQILEAVSWADRFFYDGEVFPDRSASWSDTLTWTWTPAMGEDVADTITWSDEFTLPDRSAYTSDTLTWSDVFGADVNLLGIGRYRR